VTDAGAEVPVGVAAMTVVAVALPLLYAGLMTAVSAFEAGDWLVLAATALGMALAAMVTMMVLGLALGDPLPPESTTTDCSE